MFILRTFGNLKESHQVVDDVRSEKLVFCVKDPAESFKADSKEEDFYFSTKKNF